MCNAYRLVTGYALSDDGLWRQHSWVMDDQVIYETTVKRTQYYGFVLDPAEAVRFWVTNFLLPMYSGALNLLLVNGRELDLLIVDLMAAEAECGAPAPAGDGQ